MRLLGRLSAIGVDCALVLCVVFVLGPIVSVDSSQPASRLALTAAVAEHHSVDISRYRPVLGVDYSVHDGLRSDKAPGQPFFAVPAYLAARAVGAESAAHRRVDGNLTLWWVTFWSATLPFAALLVLMRRMLVRTAPRVALPLTLAFAGGALVLPYSVNLYGHVLAAFLAFAAWSCIDRDAGSQRQCALGGVLAGAAVFTEYQAVAVAAVLFVFLLRRSRLSARAFALGGSPWVIALGCYEWVAFGAPWHLPYSTYRGQIDGTADMGARNPLRGIAEIVGGGHGLVVTAPLVLVGGIACALAIRYADNRVRTHAGIALAVFAAYVVVVSSFAGSDLTEIPGPRFIIPALPFLMLPLAWAMDRLWSVVLVTATWGALLMAAATWTTLVVGRNAPVFDQERFFVQHRQFAPTLWSLGLGRIGTVLYGVSCVGAVGVLVGVALRSRAAEEHPMPRALPVPA